MAVCPTRPSFVFLERHPVLYIRREEEQKEKFKLMDVSIFKLIMHPLSATQLVPRNCA